MSRHRDDTTRTDDPATLQRLADDFDAMARAAPRDIAVHGLLVAAEHTRFLARSLTGELRVVGERETVDLAEVWQQRRAG